MIYINYILVEPFAIYHSTLLLEQFEIDRYDTRLGQVGIYSLF